MYIIYIFIDVYAYHMHELYQYSIYIALCIYLHNILQCIYLFIYIYMYIRQTNMQSIDLKFLGHSTVGVIFQVEVLFSRLKFCLPSMYLSIFNPHLAGSPFFADKDYIHLQNGGWKSIVSP